MFSSFGSFPCPVNVTTDSWPGLGFKLMPIDPPPRSLPRSFPPALVHCDGMVLIVPFPSSPRTSLSKLSQSQSMSAV